ncbi:MAG: hypothetical protein JXB39_03145 [Deltaproteobacteria bacterium]|nr:hypothetical protein [Deltaproteobacteria bacterium]
MIRLLLVAFLAACPLHRPEGVREQAAEVRHLSEAADAYWQAIRWRSFPDAARYVEDGEPRIEFLRRWSVDPPRQVVDAVVVHVSLGDPLPPDRAPVLREGTVLVRVEGHGPQSPVMGVELVEQAWQLGPEGWRVAPGDLGHTTIRTGEDPR